MKKRRESERRVSEWYICFTVYHFAHPFRQDYDLMKTTTMMMMMRLPSTERAIHYGFGDWSQDSRRKKTSYLFAIHFPLSHPDLEHVLSLPSFSTVLHALFRCSRDPVLISSQHVRMNEWWFTTSDSQASHPSSCVSMKHQFRAYTRYPAISARLMRVTQKTRSIRSLEAAFFRLSASFASAPIPQRLYGNHGV